MCSCLSKRIEKKNIFSTKQAMKMNTSNGENNQLVCFPVYILLFSVLPGQQLMIIKLKEHSFHHNWKNNIQEQKKLEAKLQ